MRDRLEMLTETLRREYASLGDAPLEVHVFTLRHLLSALLLMFSAHESGAIRPSSPIFEAFRRAVEDEFRTLHHVQDYANRLRYSTRTLTRVVTAATGRGAKQYIDDRVLLEAKRILAHTDMTVNTIAKQLGFPTSTDFARFFRFRMGVTPARFRDLTQVRAAGGASQPKNAAASS